MHGAIIMKRLVEHIFVLQRHTLRPTIFSLGDRKAEKGERSGSAGGAAADATVPAGECSLRIP